MHVQVQVEIIHQTKFLHMTWIDWEYYPTPDISLSGKYNVQRSPLGKKKSKTYIDIGGKTNIYFNSLLWIG